LHADFYADSATQACVPIIENVQLARDTYRIRFECPAIARRMVPKTVAERELVVRLPGAKTESYPTAVPALVGRHNQANALAALLASRLLGCTHAEALRALTEFQPLAHRMELVAKAGGVLFYDDSKGTNVGAVVAALDGFPRRVVLIAGGRDKGGDYGPLAQAMARVGRAAVLIGEAAEKLEVSFRSIVPVERAATMEDAVSAAARFAQPGDAVVLSPACSSFDMFRDYAHRAQVFRAAVERLAGADGTSGVIG